MGKGNMNTLKGSQEKNLSRLDLRIGGEEAAGQNPKGGLSVQASRVSRNIKK